MGRDPSGKRLRKKLASKDPAELVKGLKLQIRDIDDGLPTPSERLTLGEFLTETWLPWKKRDVLEATYVGYESTVRRHVIPAKGKVSLTKLHPQDLEDWYANLRDKGVGPRTVLKIRSIVAMALEYAVGTFLVKRNVAAMIKPPKYQPEPKTFLTEKQVVKLLKEAAGKPIFPLILAAITTQIRPGELYALDWEHVDLEHRIIQVARTMTDTKKGAVVGRKPKTRTSIRKVRIPQVLANALKRARAGSNSPYVFPSPDGARLRRQNVQRRWWKPLLEAAGLPDITFYELRSSGANIADKIPDVPRAILSARMGHTDTKTTEIYLDPNVVLQSPIADRFDEVFKSFRAAVPPSTVPTAVPTKGGSAVRGKDKARY
jgi:integrase